MNARPTLAGLLAIAFLALGHHAQPGHAGERLEVDLELVLAVDVSPSMNAAERALQRDGYVAAFRHPDLWAAIRSGMLGRIAVTYVEWSGPHHQHVIVPWAILAEAEDAYRFADVLASAPATGKPGTSISGGLFLARDLFLTSPAFGLRRIVDVSGDGTNNSGPPIAPIRTALLNQGVVINGLPITLPTRVAGDDFNRFGSKRLKSYFQHCVIGGPGAFLIAVEDISNIAVAIRRKLILEIASARPRIIPASFRQEVSNFDCLAIGARPGR